MQAVLADRGEPHAPPQEWPLFDERVLSMLDEDIGDDGALDVGQLLLAETPRMDERLE